MVVGAGLLLFLGYYATVAAVSEIEDPKSAHKTPIRGLHLVGRGAAWLRR